MYSYLDSYIPSTVQAVVENLKRRLRSDPYPKKINAV